MEDRTRRKWRRAILAGSFVLLFIAFTTLLPPSDHPRLLPPLAERLQAVPLDRFRQTFEQFQERPYTCDPGTVKTLKDLASLRVTRAREFRAQFADDVEYGRHEHEFGMRPRSPEEIDLILTLLDEFTAQTPWNHDKLKSILDEIECGVHDIRVLEKLGKLYAITETRYLDLQRYELSPSTRRDISLCTDEARKILEAVGHTGLSESLEFLLNLVRSKPTEANTSWSLHILWGALRAICSLPSHLSIPALETIYDRWFGNALAPEQFMDNHDLRSLVIDIDGAYRKGLNEPPLLPPGYWPEYRVDPSWPRPVLLYGPGGIGIPFPRELMSFLLL